MVVKQVAVQGISLVSLAISTDECVRAVTVVILRGLYFGLRTRNENVELNWLCVIDCHNVSYWSSFLCNVMNYIFLGFCSDSFLSYVYPLRYEQCDNCLLSSLVVSV